MADYLNMLESRYVSPRAYEPEVSQVQKEDAFLERLRLAEERDRQAAESLATALAESNPVLKRTLLRLYKVRVAEWRACDEVFSQ